MLGNCTRVLAECRPHALWQRSNLLDRESEVRGGTGSCKGVGGFRRDEREKI
jgi:hypothetical protein